MERIFHYHITEKEAGYPIRDFLYKKGYSRQNIIALKKKEDSILLNGKWEYMNCRLRPGDELIVKLLEERSNEQILPVDLPFPIVYEDEDLLVINKPADMPTHPSLNNYTNTLANAAAFYFAKQGISYTFRCINRLDKDTTGLTILAKHMLSAGILSKMVQDRTILREYRALVSGTLPQKCGTIDAPIGREHASLITRRIDPVNGERAVTHYQVLKEYDTFSYVSLRLETGRTHQIRVHMASVGCPLLGDYLYHPAYSRQPCLTDSCALQSGRFLQPTALQTFSCPDTQKESLSARNLPALTRQALHAYRLSFLHPITGKPLTFTAPLPDDMSALLTGSSL
ncbi:MAG: RluA family pseudouridine synthase [Lachnospiraceae bacterium]|jgi:23S rRNA pseudouridine1911/1915/1917 synthase|nr:RluA family pseudouridine synthase [Lachnospiraceae bacterium]